MIMLAVASCVTKREAATTTMSMQELSAAEFDIIDTLYIPWQLWAGDTAAPLPIVKATHGRARGQRQRSDTTKVEKKKEVTLNSYSESRKIHFSWLAVSIVLFIISLWLVYAVRRR